MSRQLGLMAEENGRRRAYLPPPAGRPVPFLLIGGRLVCPWRRARELIAWQAAALEAVRVMLAEAAAVAPLPALAWVSVADGVTPVPGTPSDAWLQARIANGMPVPARAW